MHHDDIIVVGIGIGRYQTHDSPCPQEACQGGDEDAVCAAARLSSADVTVEVRQNTVHSHKAHKGIRRKQTAGRLLHDACIRRLVTSVSVV